MMATDTGSGVLFWVKVHPRAGRDRLVGIVAGKLKAEVSAPPVKGKANRGLIKLLSGLFNIPGSSVEIVRGENKSAKLIRIRGISATEIKRKLDEQAKI